MILNLLLYVAFEAQRGINIQNFNLVSWAKVFLFQKQNFKVWCTSDLPNKFTNAVQ